MFLLWKNILFLPMILLIHIGTPFKFDTGSSLRNYSESDLKEKYRQAKIHHYADRIGPAFLLIAGSLMFFFFVWLSSGYVFLLFPIITIIVLGIDALMIFCRYLYFKAEEKKAEEGGTALVLQDAWKDTSLKSLLDRKKVEREKWLEEFRERTGREPYSHEY